MKINFDKAKAICREHYEDVLNRYGDSPQGVNWANAESQGLRFQIISEICDLNDKKVHDVGCGLGHFYDFLTCKGVNCDYVGSDISLKMIEEAKKRLPGVQFYTADILDDVTPDWMQADYVITSGLFYVRVENSRKVWRHFIEAMLLKMFTLAREGIAFNMLTSYVNYEEAHLFYLHPGEILDFCVQKLSRRVAIRHDYPLWEYTVYVHKLDNILKTGGEW